MAAWSAGASSSGTRCVRLAPSIETWCFKQGPDWAPEGGPGLGLEAAEFHEILGGHLAEEGGAFGEEGIARGGTMSGT